MKNEEISNEKSLILIDRMKKKKTNHQIEVALEWNKMSEIHLFIIKQS